MKRGLILQRTNDYARDEGELKLVSKVPGAKNMQQIRP